VRVLDGAWSAWQRAGGAVESGPGPTPRRGDLTVVAGGMAVVEADAVGRVDVLIDARAAERYRGEVEPVDPVAGHITGAVNVPTSRNLEEDGRFRPVEELRAVYDEVGALHGGAVAAYCGSGVTAAHDVLALELLGVRAALYPGSWSGWITDPDRPVATGPTSGSP
jgi:thiosulfate/3-mercaptopyruvate sulfurtransferase